MTIQVTNKKKTPHLAITHQAQGGSANMRHVSLVMKSVDELSPEETALLGVVLDEKPKQGVEKATYMSLSSDLTKAVRAKVEAEDRWSWSYVRDFDDTHVVYSKEGGVFAAPYSVNDGEITIGDPIVVNEMLSWEDSDGKIIVTQSGNISSEVKGLVIKSFESPKLDNEKLVEIFKSRYEENMEKDELLKQNENLQSEIEKSQAKVAELQAQLDEITKSQKEEKDAARMEIVKSVTTEDNAEALFQSLKDLDDASFTTIVKSMEGAAKLAQDKSGMFEEIQKSASELEKTEQTQEQSLMEYIQAQQAK